MYDVKRDFLRYNEKSTVGIKGVEMPNFIRARSAEHKEERMAEVKLVAERLFQMHPYHEISLASISEELGWPRANLYKYVTSKEEIFLQLHADKFAAYVASIKAAFPMGSQYSLDVFAEVWAGIINSQRGFFQLDAVLTTIFETNVTLERLVAFKKGYFSLVGTYADVLATYLNIDKDSGYKLGAIVHFQAIGLINMCSALPIVVEASTLAGFPPADIDLKQEMKEFIIIMLGKYQNPLG